MSAIESSPREERDESSATSQARDVLAAVGVVDGLSATIEGGAAASCRWIDNAGRHPQRGKVERR